MTGVVKRNDDHVSTAGVAQEEAVGAEVAFHARKVHQHHVAQVCVAWCGVVECGVVECGVVWCSVVWRDVAWWRLVVDTPHLIILRLVHYYGYIIKCH